MRKTNILWVIRGTAKPDLCCQLRGRWCPGSRGILWRIEGLLGIRRRVRAESCSGGENSKWKPERKREPADVRSGTWALCGCSGERGRWRPKWTEGGVCLKGSGVRAPEVSDTMARQWVPGVKLRCFQAQNQRTRLAGAQDWDLYWEPQVPIPARRSAPRGQASWSHHPKPLHLMLQFMREPGSTPSLTQGLSQLRKNSEEPAGRSQSVLFLAVQRWNLQTCYCCC